MDLRHDPVTPLYVIGFVVLVVLVIRGLFGDRREVARCGADWRGMNRPEARQFEVMSLRANSALNYLLGLVLLTVAFGGLVWRVFCK